MDVTTALWYVAGVVVLLLLLQVLARPLAFLLKVLGNSLAGGVVLWLVNLVGATLGFHLALNPVTAVVVGLLGLPGLAGLGIMRLLLR
ncbi:MAG TPA: pro-sigmaK processing inhibitor BofA family protein [Symbiobacteriaceae bacterium]|jgi:inhibitor of the pro-sigma K processing machinery